MSICAAARAEICFSPLQGGLRGGGLTARTGSLGAGGFDQALQPRLVLPRRVKRRVERREIRLRRLLARALQGEERGQLVDLAVQLVQRRILARHLAREKELGQHEHGQEKDDDEQHGRQGVDETRPVIEGAGRAPRASQRHQWRSGSEARRRSRPLISLFCSAWDSTQSRICCCSERMCCTRA